MPTLDAEHGKPLKALVLCAGYGTRLKPLTDVVPKPLVTVLNVPLVDAAIYRCVKAGALDIAINAHHLPEKMGAHVTRTHGSLGVRSLFISEETPEILGTGGALSAIIGWWGDSLLLVYNGDILSNLDLEGLVARHHQLRPFVTMSVLSTPPAGNGRSVWVGNDGLVKAIAKRSDLPKDLNPMQLKECGFACAYLASPELINYLPRPAKFHDIIESFQAAIKDGKKIYAEFHRGFWADVGTHRSLWEANLEVAKLSPGEQIDIFGPLPVERTPQGLFLAKVDSVSVVSPRSKIGDNATISSSVVLDGGQVGIGESVASALRGPGFSQSF